MLRRESGCYSAILGLFFGLFFLAGCGFSVVCVWIFLLDWKANNRYLPNTCVVLDRRLATGISDVVVVRGDLHTTEQRPSFHPEIRIRYEVGGKKYDVWTYDVIARFSTDRAAQQAVLDGFRVGATYPCWYDPDRPDRAVLVRGHAWDFYLVPMVPIVFLVFGGAGLRHLWKDGGKRAH
jgi:hypothetical protein